MLPRHFATPVPSASAFLGSAQHCLMATKNNKRKLRPVPLDDEPRRVRPRTPAASAASASQIPAEKDEPVPLPLGLSRKGRQQARSDLRAMAHKEGRPPPKTFNPSGYIDLPPICNRVAAEWGKPPLPCACKDEWPRFLSQAVPTGQARIPPY